MSRLELLALAASLIMRPALACADGAALFAGHCAPCHQFNGNGIAGIYPPLAMHVGRYVWFGSGRAYVVHVPSFGMTGKITAGGQEIEGLMPPVRDLSDADLAAVLNYVLQKLNRPLLPKDFTPITADEVKRYRAHGMSPEAVHEERRILIEALGKVADAEHRQ